MAGVRIAKFIANSGLASRRGAEDLIASGVVAVNGVVIDSPVCFVNESDVVTINGQQVSSQSDTKLYMFHKPVNVMTTARDTHGRKTIYDCLGDEYKNLKYVGRLDYKTTGLLLLTNDGALARKLTLPKSGIKRTYIATVNRSAKTNLDIARRGVTVDGIRYQPMDITEQPDGTLRVTISEGKKNEVRIVLRASGAPVRKLHRISFGNISLGKLAVGKICAVDKKTIDEMLKSL